MTKEEVMSESEGAYYFSSFSCWKNLWTILEEIIKRFKTVIAYMGFASQSQDHAQPQTRQSIVCMQYAPHTHTHTPHIILCVNFNISCS